MSKSLVDTCIYETYWSIKLLPYANITNISTDITDIISVSLLNITDIQYYQYCRYRYQLGLGYIENVHCDYFNKRQCDYC